MKITLTDGQEFTPILVTGGDRFVQGRSRDTLCFVFPGTENVDDLNLAFAPGNCETITIENGDETYIHAGYTIRAEVSKKPVEVSPETADSAAVYEDRITVCMAQRTYTENQIAATQAAVEMLCMPDVE